MKTYIPESGIDICTACEEAVMLARAFKCDVGFRFNKIDLVATVDSTAKELMYEYDRKRPGRGIDVIGFVEDRGVGINPMNERAFLCFIAVLCIVLVLAGLLGASVAWAAGYPRWIVPGVVMSILSFWIGSSVASVLKQTQNKDNQP